MSSELDQSNKDLLNLWTNLGKSLVYHQNEFSKASQRLAELRVVLAARGLTQPALPTSILWVLHKIEQKK